MLSEPPDPPARVTESEKTGTKRYLHKILGASLASFETFARLLGEPPGNPPPPRAAMIVRRVRADDRC